MPQRVHKIGLDANLPIDNQGNIAARLKEPEIIANSGASWLRLNFVLGPYATPSEQKWRNTYDKIVNQYLDTGMNIYGLIGHESVRSNVGLPDFFQDPVSQTGDPRANQWLEDYLNNFAAIVSYFYPRVKVFESFNEPDNWKNGRNWIHPTWFAVMLTKIYNKIKGDSRLRRVTLVSGPLQGLSQNNNAAVNYLSDTYRYGKNALGWGTTNQSYPFDGVGYHLYVLEGYNDNWAQHERDMRKTYRDFTAAIRRVIKDFEGRDQFLYISETGWPSAEDNQRAKVFQAKHASLILELMNKDPAVAIGIWFCTEDFEPKEKFYGLYERGNPTPQGRKPAYEAYKIFCENLLKEEAKKEKERMASIKQQIVDLQGQLATRLRAYGRPVPSVSGTIQEQINQLRSQIISLRPDFAAPLNAVAGSSLTQQLIQFANYVNQIPPQPAVVGSGSPGLEQPETSLTAQIETLQSKLAILLQAYGRPASPVSGAMREQINQLRQQIISLRPDFGPQLNAIASSPFRQQVVLFQDYVDEIPPKPSVTEPQPQGQDNVLQQLTQLRSQLADLERRLPDGTMQPGSQTQLETLNTRITDLQKYIQELMLKQAQLQGDLQALQAQLSAAGPPPITTAPTIGQPPAKGQVTPPPIQDITNQLPRHPNPAKPFSHRSPGQIRYIIIQHTNNDANIGALPIANYLVRAGQAGLTYHYFITDQAAIQQTNDLTTVTNHPAVVTVGFAGKFMAATPTPQQIEAGAALIAWLLTHLNLTVEAVRGAKEVSATGSPGDTWDSGPRWGDQLRSRIQALL